MKTELDYVAVCPECKRVLAWAAGNLLSNDLADSLASWVRNGYSVERLSTAGAREAGWGHVAPCSRVKMKTKEGKTLFPVT